MKLSLKILTIFIVVATIFALSSCNKSDIPDGMIEIGTEFTGYHFYVPDNWTNNSNGGFVAAKLDDGSSVSLQTMTLGGVFENNSGYVFYVGSDTYSSIDEYFKNVYSKNLSDTFVKYVLKEEYTVNQKFGDVERCAKYIYEITIDDTEFMFEQIFTINGMNMYLFTYTSKASTFDSHLEDISKIVKNFKF